MALQHADEAETEAEGGEGGLDLQKRMAVFAAALWRGVFEHLGIARGLAIGACHEEGEPEQGIEPVQRHEHAEQGVQRQVVSLQVHELVAQDETCLRGGEVVLKTGGKQQHRPQQAGDGRALDCGCDEQTRWMAQTDLPGHALQLGQGVRAHALAGVSKPPQSSHEREAAHEKHQRGPQQPGEQTDALPVDGCRSGRGTGGDVWQIGLRQRRGQGCGRDLHDLGFLLQHAFQTPATLGQHRHEQHHQHGKPQRVAPCG